MIRRLLWPLTPLYAAASAAKNAAYDHGWKTPRRLRWPVVSVGNLSVGGTGKTPLVICLAGLLKERGMYVNVISRGYGRKSVAVERVDPQGSSERFGDEPLLIAQAADVAVYVGTSRHEAGRLAENDHSGHGIHLLDDGFQHRRLARDVDIVMVHRSYFEETLLPAGNLREPFSALRRASILVLRDEDADLEPQLRQQGIVAPMWRISRNIEMPGGLERAVAFCGIGRPEEFFSSLRAAGMQIAEASAFPDHHAYTDADLQRLATAGRKSSAQAFLTTEKDFVRMSQEQRAMLCNVLPLQAAKLRVVIDDASASIQQLLSLLPASPEHSV